MPAPLGPTTLARQAHEAHHLTGLKNLNPPPTYVVAEWTRPVGKAFFDSSIRDKTLKGMLLGSWQERLVTIMITSDKECEDDICCDIEVQGEFSVYSAYEALKHDASLNVDKDWNIIWKLNIPNRIKTFF